MSTKHGIDDTLFSRHEHALDQAHGSCPVCAGHLIVKHSKKGPFIGCQNYPECDYLQPLHPNDAVIKQVLAGTQCPECGHELALKKGKYGLFVGCTHFPQCQHSEHIDEPDDTGVMCPECGKGKLLERVSRYGKTFYACSTYPDCRYSVKGKPHPQRCSDCGWPLLIEKKIGGKVRLICPQQGCRFRSESL